MLKGKIAVVTGSNRGIGKAILKILAANGADVFACSRRQSAKFQEDCQKISEQYEVSVYPIFFDLSIEEEIKEGMKEIFKKKCAIDILVNNAGVIPEKHSFFMTSMSDMKSVFDVNYFGQILVTQYIARNMLRNKKGSIINMTSVAAIDGEPSEVEYASSKAAMIGATKKLAIELGKDNIRVNGIAPGIISTEMGNAMEMEYQEKTLNRSIMKRVGTVNEVANVVLFLASDLSSYITSQIIRVDGGMI